MKQSSSKPYNSEVSVVSVPSFVFMSKDFLDKICVGSYFTRNNISSSTEVAELSKSYFNGTTKIIMSKMAVSINRK